MKQILQQDSNLNLTYISIVNNKRQNVEIKSSHTNQNTCTEWGIVSHEAHMTHGQSKPIRFAYETGISIVHPELVCSQNIMNDAFANLNKWFKGNKLALNVDKTNYINFATRSKNCIMRSFITCTLPQV
jgi:hypothetical protein